MSNNQTIGAQQKQNNYVVPFIIMVVLMSLVGLITNLNQQFQAPMKAAYLLMGGEWSNTLATALNFAFFLAYLVMGPASANYIAKKGYKKTLLLGLTILCVAFALYMSSAWVFEQFDYATFEGSINEARAIEAQKANGLEAMIAEASKTGNFRVEQINNEYNGLTYLKGMVIPVAYWVFLVAAFVAGTALTYLQAVINPYLVACEVKGTTGVTRQSIAGTGNSTMTTIGPLLVAYVIFSGKEGLDISLTSLYVPFAVLLLFVVILAFALTKIELPEVVAGGSGSSNLPESVWSFSQLKWGFVALFCYVGVEVAVGANGILYAQSDLGFSLERAALMSSIYWGGMLLGRFLGSFLSAVQAQTQLLIGSIGATLFIVLAMVIGNPWLLCAVGLFHSIMWGAIFALSLEGLGRYTSKASGVMMMAVFGGALIPLIQGFLADVLGSWTWTWLFVIAGELFILYYAISGHKVKKVDSGYSDAV